MKKATTVKQNSDGSRTKTKYFRNGNLKKIKTTSTQEDGKTKEKETFRRGGGLRTRKFKEGGDNFNTRVVTKRSRDGQETSSSKYTKFDKNGNRKIVKFKNANLKSVVRTDSDGKVIDKKTPMRDAKAKVIFGKKRAYKNR